MGICRDALGRLAYTFVTPDKRVFSISEGENRIVRHEPYTRTNARILWNEVEPFDSFIKGVRFLKENHTELM